MRHSSARTAAVAAGLLAVAALPGCEEGAQPPRAPSVETATFTPDYLATQNGTAAYSVQALVRRPDDFLGRRIEFTGGLSFVGSDIPPAVGEQSTKFLYEYRPDLRTALVVLSPMQLPNDITGVRGTWVKNEDQYYLIADEARFNSWNSVVTPPREGGK